LGASWRSQGTLGIIQCARDRLIGAQSSFAAEVLDIADGARGIEIGGPSRLFGRHGVIPIYPVMGILDNVNFSDQTLWEESLGEGTPYAPTGIPIGIQFLRESTDLRDIPNHSYDVVLSSHCLEHIANPLRALKEWRRICKPGGYLCLIVPHRDRTFDWKRPVTPMDHYLSDEHSNVDEGDVTHFDEVIRLHDLRRDSGVRSVEDLKRRVADNLKSRAVHHHVFDLRSTAPLIRAAGWTPTAMEARRPSDIFVFAQNSTSSFTEYNPASIVRGSPFRSDQQIH